MQSGVWKMRCTNAPSDRGTGGGGSRDGTQMRVHDRVLWGTRKRVQSKRQREAIFSDISFFFDQAATVLQQYKTVSGSKYTLRIYHSFFPCQRQGP